MEFKKLSAVDVVGTASKTANVLIEEDGVIKKVAKDEVGSIKVASAAEVGQTIVVKAVDENGKPTEWECADMYKEPEYDLVFECTDNCGTPSIGGFKPLPKEDLDKAFQKIKNKKMLKLLFYWFTAENGGSPHYAVSVPMHYTCYGDYDIRAYAYVATDYEGSLNYIITIRVTVDGIYSVDCDNIKTS